MVCDREKEKEKEGFLFKKCDKNYSSESYSQ